MKKITALLLVMTMTIIVNAQQQTSRLKLYFDCSQIYCDFDFIRQQMSITDFVRDRKESDVHIMINAHQAGNGGQQYEMIFLGQKSWLANADTFRFLTQSSSTQDDIRRMMLKVMRAGIAPYLVKNGQLEKIDISFKDPGSQTNVQAKDRWNNWVFSVGGRGRFSGDKNYKEKNISANFSANRITNKSKLSFSIYNSLSKNSYSIEENGENKWLTTHSKYAEAEQDYVKSLSSKWSWAVQSAFRKSTYDNILSSLATSTGIEYNIFPYKLSSTKFMVFRYMISVTKRNYMEETIFDKKKETLYSNDLSLYANFTQPWGSISTGIEWYNYFHDVTKNNLSIDANVELKLFKGISLNFYGNGSLIHDQLSLAKAGASAQDILLRLKALSTSFNYYTGIGINYRFGSKFNNTVNPRFTNGRW